MGSRAHATAILDRVLHPVTNFSLQRHALTAGRWFYSVAIQASSCSRWLRFNALKARREDCA